MAKKLTILLAGLIMLCAFTGCGEKDMQHYEGVINICEKISDEEFILLYHNIISSDQTEAPVYEDNLSKYNIKTQENELLFTANDLWTNYDNQMLFVKESIVYNNGSKITEFSQYNDQWQGQVIADSDSALKMISPSASKYVIRYDDYLEVIDRANFKQLAQTALISDVSEMLFSTDENTIAMITDYRSALSLWDWQNGEITGLNVGKELSEVQNWVEISDIAYSEDDKYLYITYLCENGCALDVWDMEAEKVADHWSFAGDMLILDIYGGKVLLSVDEGKDQHTLYIYDSVEKSLAAREKSTSFYTSGSFIDKTKVLVNKYDATAKTNNLALINI